MASSSGMYWSLFDEIGVGIPSGGECYPEADSGEEAPPLPGYVQGMVFSFIHSD